MNIHRQINSHRIATLQRQIVAADETGKAHNAIAEALREAARKASTSIARDVFQAEIDRNDALVEEMRETSVELSHQLANEERLSTQLGGR